MKTKYPNYIQNIMFLHWRIKSKSLTCYLQLLILNLLYINLYKNKIFQILHHYPKSWYMKWLNSSLIQVIVLNLLLSTVQFHGRVQFSGRRYLLISCPSLASKRDRKGEGWIKMNISTPAYINPCTVYISNLFYCYFT